MLRWAGQRTSSRDVKGSFEEEYQPAPNQRGHMRYTIRLSPGTRATYTLDDTETGEEVLTTGDIDKLLDTANLLNGELINQLDALV